MMDVDAVVVGAGVVGLAVARALAFAGREVVVLEAASAIGTGTSSRNSEVIHAGLYYPTGSLKARLCVEGNRRLYEYAAAHGIAHRRVGKLIVATQASQHAELERLLATGRANGVDDLRWVDRSELSRLEPEVRAVEALLSPSTGIVDSHQFMLALQGEAEDRGASIAFEAPVVGGRVLAGGGVELDVGGREPIRIRARSFVNCAGLGAPALAASLEGMPAEHVPRGYLCKGNYFTLTGRTPFTHLVYPVPEAAGLGVHVTLDLAGRARFGPDVEWVERIDYAVDASRAASFEAAIRRYWPGLPDGALTPGYAGIRPKIQAPGDAARDFVISGPAEHGVAGVVNLFGIESPGLTSALAIADVMGGMLLPG